MVELSRRLMAPVAALAFAAVLPTVARAADLLPPPPSLEMDEERVTFGTGWYLRGDIGASQDVKLSIGGTTLPRNSDFFNSWNAGLGFGYKYNDWFRTDVTGDWNNPRTFRGNTASGVPCQIGAVGTPFGPGPYTGSAGVYSACSDYVNARIQAFNVLVNGYVDLGTWAGVTPYVGAGVGFTNIYQKFTRNWYMNNGNPYAPVWTDPFTQGTYQAYWDQTRSTNSFQFAWAAMAGFSYAFTRNAAIDIGYRYLNLGKVTTYSLYGTSTQNLYSNQLRVGIRYTPD